MTDVSEIRIAPRGLERRHNAVGSLTDEEPWQGKPWKVPLVVAIGLLRELTPYRMVNDLSRAPITHEMKLCEEYDIGIIWPIHEAMDTEPVEFGEMHKCPHRGLLGG
jgi:hypothetical protein